MQSISYLNAASELFLLLYTVEVQCDRCISLGFVFRSQVDGNNDRTVAGTNQLLMRGIVWSNSC